MGTAKGKTPQQVVKAARKTAPPATDAVASGAATAPAATAPQPGEATAPASAAPQPTPAAQATPAAQRAPEPTGAAAFFVPPPERVNALKATVEAIAAARGLTPSEVSVLAMEAGLTVLAEEALLAAAANEPAVAPEGGALVKVTGPKQGRFRIGRKFDGETTAPFPVTAEQLSALESDPLLQVQRV